jgi:RNA polymerase sigma-70 factor (ECF subfamily)
MQAFDFDVALERIQGRDEVAFAELWRRHHPMLLRYLRVIVGDAAEDVASETWIAVVRALPRFVGDEQNFRSWLITIGRNRAMDYGRSRQRQPAVLQSAEELDENPAPTPDPAVFVVERLSAHEAVDLVTRTLPPLQAEAVILRSVLGLDVTEVARIMDKRAGTIRVLSHRGLRRLEQTFAKRRAVQHG